MDEKSVLFRAILISVIPLLAVLVVKVFGGRRK